MRKTKNIGIIILNIIKTLFFIFAVVMVIFTIISVTKFDKNKNSGIFGYKFFIVLSDSMKGIFEAGDIIICKNIKMSEIKVGDIITFKSIDPEKYGEVITHKVRSITTYEGQEAFFTYGVATGNDDDYPAVSEKIMGKYSLKISKLGYVFQFIKSPTGYATLIFTPLFLLILSECFRFSKLAKNYRLEKKADRESKEQEAEAEKMKLIAMSEELQKLREQIQKNEKNE